jgi:NAD-dependent dihydropyrimidine dehydrogenase PreA subunit
MSFIIGSKCVSTCDTACVNACPVDCIHGPIDINGSGAEVKGLSSVEGLQLYINPDDCIDCGACVDECPVSAIYESEDDCIKSEGNDESVKKNYAFFGQEYQA